MILKQKWKKKLPSSKTSKNIALNPIHISNKVFIPIQQIEFEAIEFGVVTLFGKVDFVGFVQIDQDNIELLSFNKTLTVESLITNIPELSDMINSVNKPEEVL